MVCGRCVEDCCDTKAIVSGAELLCATRKGGAMRTNVSRLTGRGLWCRGMSCLYLLDRGYCVRGRREEVRCVEVIVSGRVRGAAVR